MKVVIRKTARGRAPQWVQRILFAGGTLMLAYCAYVVVDAWVFQHRERRNLEHLLRENRPPPAWPASPTESFSPPAIGPDGLIGRIEIQRLSISLVIVEGTDEPTLRRAAGHIIGTALPGEAGNMGIAAHRDTFFRPLRNIQRNDIIMLATLRGDYRYRVVSTKVVSPNDIGVLDSDGSEILTLVTCYPFYFIGAAPQRFIVRAERVT